MMGFEGSFNCIYTFRAEVNARALRNLYCLLIISRVTFDAVITRDVHNMQRVSRKICICRIIALIVICCNL